MSIKKELIATFKNLMGVFLDVNKVFSPSDLQISNKAIGGKVEQINQDGSLSPLEDGTYSMDDGFTFTVADGLITDIEDQSPQSEDYDDTYDDTYAKKPKVSGDTGNVATVPANQDPVPSTFTGDTSTSGTTADDTMVDSTEDTDSDADSDSDSDAAVAALTNRVTVLEQQLATLTAMLTTANNEKMAAQKAVEQFNKIVTELNDNIKTLAKIPVESSKTNKTIQVEASKESKKLDIARILGNSINQKK